MFRKLTVDTFGATGAIPDAVCTRSVKMRSFVETRRSAEVWELLRETNRVPFFCDEPKRNHPTARDCHIINYRVCLENYKTNFFERI